jgi:hypothetical protein
MAMSVIPTWMVERKRLGDSEMCKTSFAFLFPFRINSSSLDFREETIAISDIAKSPFKRIRKIRIRICSVIYLKNIIPL